MGDENVTAVPRSPQDILKGRRGAIPRVPPVVPEPVAAEPVVEPIVEPEVVEPIVEPVVEPVAAQPVVADPVVEELESDPDPVVITKAELEAERARNTDLMNKLNKWGKLSLKSPTEVTPVVTPTPEPVKNIPAQVKSPEPGYINDGAVLISEDAMVALRDGDSTKFNQELHSVASRVRTSATEETLRSVKPIIMNEVKKIMAAESAWTNFFGKYPSLIAMTDAIRYSGAILENQVAAQNPHYNLNDVMTAVEAEWKPVAAEVISSKPKDVPRVPVIPKKSVASVPDPKKPSGQSQAQQQQRLLKTRGNRTLYKNR